MTEEHAKVRIHSFNQRKERKNTFLSPGEKILCLLSSPQIKRAGSVMSHRYLLKGPSGLTL